MSSQKFRPYLTASEMLEIISALKESPSTPRISILRYLESFKLKIDHGVITSSYTPESKVTIAQKLGFEPTITEHDRQLKIRSKQLAYQKYQEDKQSVNPVELSLAYEYMWENDLLTPEQNAQYEQSLLSQ